MNKQFFGVPIGNHNDYDYFDIYDPETGEVICLHRERKCIKYLQSDAVCYCRSCVIGD